MMYHSETSLVISVAAFNLHIMICYLLIAIWLAIQPWSVLIPCQNFMLIRFGADVVVYACAIRYFPKC